MPRATRLVESEGEFCRAARDDDASVLAVDAVRHDERREHVEDSLATCCLQARVLDQVLHLVKEQHGRGVARREPRRDALALQLGADGEERLERRDEADARRRRGRVELALRKAAVEREAARERGAHN